MEYLLNEHVLSMLFALVSAVVGWVYRRNVSKKFRQRVAMRALEAAVHDAWVKVVRDLKQIAKDGKLSRQEREKLAINTMYNARSIAKNQGVDLLKELGQDYIPVLIQDIINKRKKGAA